MPKPTRIVASCDPEFHWDEDQWDIEKCGVLYIALSQHHLSFMSANVKV